MKSFVFMAIVVLGLPANAWAENSWVENGSVENGRVEDSGEKNSRVENGKVTSVTLYRNQAVVTRTITVSGDEGNSEIVVGNLPENIVADSLFAEGAESVEVRAVQFRTRAVGASPREEVRTLQDEIQATRDLLALNSKHLELLGKQSAYLDQLEGFVAPTATVELSKGVLDAESLERITTFSFQKREEIAEKQIDFAKKQRDLTKTIELLNRKLAEITNGSSKTVREAIMFVRKSDGGDQQIRLNYLVNGCGWSPTYTIHSNEGAEKARLEYNGLIYQMSGENWDEVSLSLSTASPALSSSSPGLAPLHVTLSLLNQQQQGQVAESYQNPTKGQIQQIFNKQQLAILDNRNSITFTEFNESNWGLNDAANEFARLELVCATDALDDLKVQIDQMSEEPSLSYKLKNPVTLSSRNNRQMVRIVQTDLPGNFYHVATPVLTNYVYREAELTNDSDEDFLGGPITVYLDGKFVGRGEISTVARGQSFLVGFGADPQLRTRREMVERNDGINGGNRELKFNYRLVVENFKETEVPIRLIDRIPTSRDNADIRVTFGRSSTDLSKDELYQRTEHGSGILRWDVSVPAKSVAQSSHEVTYSYSVEYDRNYVVSLPGSVNQMRQELEMLQRKRSRR